MRPLALSGEARTQKRACVHVQEESLHAQRVCVCVRVHTNGHSIILVFVSACLCARALTLLERQRVGGNEEKTSPIISVV